MSKDLNTTVRNLIFLDASGHQSMENKSMVETVDLVPDAAPSAEYVF